MFLPGPGTCLEGQSGYVVEVRQLEKGSAPKGRVVDFQGLREIPSGSGHDEEVVVTRMAVPDFGGVVLEEVEEVEAVFGAGVVFGAVEVP